jgi:hypothetical protein
MVVVGDPEKIETTGVARVAEGLRGIEVAGAMRGRR